MTAVFISYARGDDELFAKRLYKDLTQEGFEVWWDRESLHSVSLTFHQQIKDAIRSEVDRLIYIAGPKAAVSDYVREEWKFALECEKPVIPILRMGDYDAVPGELGLLHCEDFRDDANYPEKLKKLTVNLLRPEPPLGHLFAVPTLPKHFMGRTEFLRRLKDAVQVDLQKPVVITGAASRVGVQGMGGIGKSVLAAAVARDREVRRAYPDGIIWVSFGQTPDAPQLMRDVAKHLGNPGAFENEVQGQGVLKKLLLNKAVLLVLDDVWKAKDAQAFDVLGPRCRALVTTRDAGILHTLQGELYSVDLFTEEEALSLLAASVEKTPDQLPEEARKIVRECGCLPLAVALCGGMARKRGGQWSNILKRLRQADLENIADRQSINEQHQSIWRAMQISVEALDPDEQKRFAELSVFVTDQILPEDVVGTLWAHTGNLDDLDTEDLLINLNERSLIRIERESYHSDKKASMWISLHDLLYDYALRVSGDRTELNSTLLTAYSKRCPNGWASGPNDEYFFQNLCGHMIKTNQIDEVVALLTSIPWIEAKCGYGLVFDLQNDYRDIIEVLPEAQEELKQERKHAARVARWTKEIVEYAKKWSDRRDRLAKGENITNPEPQLPEIIQSVNPWSKERIETECQRIIEYPTRLDRLKAFNQFVQSECYPLLDFGSRPWFVVQHAYNRFPGDPVRETAAELINSVSVPMLLHYWPKTARYNPKPALLKTLEGHNGRVNGVSITPDGNRAVSASFDGTLRVWELKSGICLKIMGGHCKKIKDVSITPDGKRAVSATDKILQVWDLEFGTYLKVLEGHDHWVQRVSIMPDGKHAVSDSTDKTLQVYDLESGTCLRVLKGHNRQVNDVSITPDGKRAVSASFDGTLRFWDLESGICLKTLKGYKRIPSLTWFCVSIMPNGKRAVSASTDYSLWVWDLETGACLNILEGHESGIPNISVTPDGKLAISASYDRTLRVWDLESGSCLKILKGHSDSVNDVSITPDGKCAISASNDMTLRIWDLETGSSLKTSEGHGSGTSIISVTPDGKRAVSASQASTLLSTSRDRTLRIWDLETGTCLKILKGHSDSVNDVSITPDGKRAVSTSSDGTLRVWNLETGASLKTPVGRRDRISGFSVGYGVRVSITPGGKRAVSANVDNTLRVWDLESGTCLRILKGHNRQVNDVSITPDGKRAVSASSDKILRVWDLESGVCLKILKGHKRTQSISFNERVNVTPDGKSAISASNDMTLRIWDLETGACLNILEGHSNGVKSFSVTLDGKRAVSASSDKTLRVWDLASGTCLKVLKGHSGGVNSVCVTSDGKYAVSAAIGDKILRVWDLASGQLQTLVRGYAPWRVVSFSTLFNRIIGGNSIGEVAFFDLQGFIFDPAICTAINHLDDVSVFTFRCPCCGNVSSVPEPLSDVIVSNMNLLEPGQSPCLDMPKKAFSDPRLQIPCLHCCCDIRLNPFFVDMTKP